MILVGESVWILPSLARHSPRTVNMVGRDDRSSPNFCSIARRNSGPSNASSRPLKWPFTVSSGSGCEPGPGTGG